MEEKMKRVSKRIFGDFFCNRNPVSLGYWIEFGEGWKRGTEHLIWGGTRGNVSLIAKIKKSYKKNGKRCLSYYIDKQELGAWQLSLAMNK